MKILIIGNGGREHALAWKAAQSPLASRVFVAPGNAGTAQEARIQNIDISATDLPALLQFARREAIDLTIVGAETPLVAGIVDQFQAAGLTIFGPSQSAAQLEGSKAFSKDFLIRHAIPTARYQTFTDIALAQACVRQQSFPIVIKADGLAAGKGVIIANSLNEAETTITDMLAGNKFGDAGHRIIIEEFLTGEEASFIVMADGQHAEPMATSQDHKRVADGDNGLNTGGMGAYSPAPVVSEQIHQRIMQRIIQPTLRGMAAEGNHYTGFLYAGLMIDDQGNPKVIEFNCRLGDPETQPIMLRLQSDLVELCLAACNGRLHEQHTVWDHRPALGVVMACAGYPQRYANGDLISGLPQDSIDCKIFHAGTSVNTRGQLITHGGRVLCVTALGDTVTQAQQRAYAALQPIHWRGCFYRRDIGYRAIAREITG